MDVKTKLLDIAQDLIQKDGIDSFSFRTLAQKVEIKSSSVHYYFPKKEDLLVEIIDRYNSNFFKTLASIKSTELSEKKKMNKLLKLFEDTKNENKLCLCGVFSSANDQVGVQCQAKVSEFFEKLSSWIISILNEAQKKDDLLLDLPIKSQAKILIASFEGALLIEKSDPKSSYLKSCKDLISAMIKG